MCACWDKPIIHRRSKMRHKRRISFYLKQQNPPPTTQIKWKTKGEMGSGNLLGVT